MKSLVVRRAEEASLKHVDYQRRHTLLLPKVYSGFSLLEILIVLSLIGILASVAYPSYVSQVTDGRRADGVTTLLKVAAKQETYYMDTGVYVDDMTQLGFTSDPMETPEGFYSIDAVVPADGQSFTLMATRIGVQASDDVCGDLVLMNTGIKTAVNNTTTAPLERCWQ